MATAPNDHGLPMSVVVRKNQLSYMVLVVVDVAIVIGSCNVMVVTSIHSSAGCTCNHICWSSPGHGNSIVETQINM